MSDKNENTLPADANGTAPALGQAIGSTAVVGIGGVKLQPISRDRLLQTGEKVANKHGQFLWEIVGFCPRGLRLTQWPHGALSDFSWEKFYAHFYERQSNT